jgi:aldehyde dehydrogenase (NAD+)
MDIQSIQAIFSKQRAFYKSQATKSLAYRLQCLRQLKSTIKSMELEILEALRLDLNKSSYEGFSSEIGLIYSEISHVERMLSHWIKPQKVGSPLFLMPARSFIVKEPKGVVLIIGAWNYPFQLVLAPLIGAIAAGNCVIVKPSEIAKHSESVLIRLISKAFVPEFCVTVSGGPEVSGYLTAMNFDHIFFTGSTKVGRLVMQSAAPLLTPVTLELGGKSPCIVDADIDLSVVAKRIVHGKFYNAGQTCIAPDYLLVHKSIRSQLILELKKWIEIFLGSNPKDSEHYCRVINEFHFSRLLALLKGHDIVFGGKHDLATRYFEPTLVLPSSTDSPLMREEIFGPILPILEFEKIDDVITQIEQNPSPLACYIFSNSQIFIDRVINDVSFGGGCINNSLLHFVNSNLPFGGVGRSGMGSYHGKKSFDTFSHEKSILSTPISFDIPFRYIPYRGSLALIRLLFK